MPSLFDRFMRIGEGKIRRRLEGISKQVNALEPSMEAMSDEELREETERFRERLAEGETLDDLMPEAFAVVREAARRTLGQRHFDVQIQGGAALHQGMIAEMKTGEGKTLVATLAAYLNALEGNGVHVITVNNFLAEYQSELMGRIYRFLGLSTGVIVSGLTHEERRKAYNADITYGTNNEFGFDYLRDNMASDISELVQRGHNYAIVDEVDSILIDEARTPLIISGPAGGDSNKWYAEFARIARTLTLDVDYEIDEAKRTAGILEAGIEKVEDILGIENLYESLNTPLISFLQNAIKAKELFKRDKDYVVLKGEVLIVDEHTGRMLPGRRYNEGMHQAIEAKEGVEIKAENQTFATITLQNYFRLYKKLSGMTGTAQTEAAEMQSTYKLGVVPIDTNKPMIRIDQPDLVYRTEQAKWRAVVQDIVERHRAGQPVLVGTVSVEKSEMLSRALKKLGIPHEVLNAKQHEREAHIVAQAGRKGAVTVATNMAGRGTDIMLGGNAEYLAVDEMVRRKYSLEEDPEAYETAWPDVLAEMAESVAAEHDAVVDAGGLYVLGTERHESRRIDNQLRGRSGRQGDPGESRFYLSMQDDLMRLSNMGLAEAVMERSGIAEDVPLESKVVSRGIQSSQAQVEARNLDIRKNLLKYDEVMASQRRVIYKERHRVLHGEDLAEQIQHFLTDVVTDYVAGATASPTPESWDLEELWTGLKAVFPVSITPAEVIEQAGSVGRLSREELTKELLSDAKLQYEAREELLGAEVMRDLERRVVLAVLDRRWREHLYEMDYLKEGIGMRALAQRDPLVEYQREGYGMFQVMSEAIKEESIGFLFNLQIKTSQAEDATEAEPEEEVQVPTVAPQPAGTRLDARVKGLDAEAAKPQLSYSAPSLDGETGAFGRRREATAPEADGAVYPGAARNAPCPCGSDKKYKLCHGRNEGK